jgi:hypothetical protein
MDVLSRISNKVFLFEDLKLRRREEKAREGFAGELFISVQG